VTIPSQKILLVKTPTGLKKASNKAQKTTLNSYKNQQVSQKTVP
jgi:hypothetical protein